MKTSSRSPKRIRHEKWYDRALPYIFLAVFFVAGLTLNIVFFSDSFEKRGKHKGTLSNLYQPQTEYGDAATRFLVKLDNGKTADVSATGMGPFKKGRRVLVREWRSKWLRRTRYSFIRYLEEPGSVKLAE